MMLPVFYRFWVNFTVIDFQHIILPESLLFYNSTGLISPGIFKKYKIRQLISPDRGLISPDRRLISPDRRLILPVFFVDSTFYIYIYIYIYYLNSKTKIIIYSIYIIVVI